MYNYLRHEDPDQEGGVDNDPRIPINMQENIFTLAWDMGVFQNQSVRFDGLDLLPKIRFPDLVGEDTLDVKHIDDQIGEGVFYKGEKDLMPGDHILGIDGVWVSCMSLPRTQQHQYVFRSDCVQGSVFLMGNDAKASKINAFGPPSGYKGSAENCKVLGEEPNVKMAWEGWIPYVQAVKKIVKGDQFLADYGVGYDWSTNEDSFSSELEWKVDLLPRVDDDKEEEVLEIGGDVEPTE